MLTILLTLLLTYQADTTGIAGIRAEPDGKKRAADVRQLLKRFDKSMIGPLLELGDADPDPAVRRVVVESLGGLPAPSVQEFLERHAESDPDAAVSLAALERLRERQARQLTATFHKRLALAHQQQDQSSLRLLVAEDQRWVSSSRGAILPAFLQVAPPVFTVIPPGRQVRFAAFGDFGVSGPNQNSVAGALSGYHRLHPFDFGLTLGDNFYFEGITSPFDSRWHSGWEQIYGPLHIPFFASLGNHDWGSPDSPAAEISYATRSTSWHMPALYYSFIAGPVQFFALATDALSETQLQWLDEELGRSRSRWKIVYGHEPIYSHGKYGDTPGFAKILMPVLKNRATVFLAGHEHDLQYLQPEDGVHFVIAGGGGASVRPVNPGPRTLFAQSSFGFVVFECTEYTLKLSFVDTHEQTLYKTTIR